MTETQQSKRYPMIRLSDEVRLVLLQSQREAAKNHHDVVLWPDLQLPLAGAMFLLDRGAEEMTAGYIGGIPVMDEVNHLRLTTPTLPFSADLKDLIQLAVSLARQRLIESGSEKSARLRELNAAAKEIWQRNNPTIRIS